MRVSAELIEALKQFEGCRLTSYQDSANIWTVGFGHTKGVKQGQTISYEQAISLLRGDLLTFERAVGAIYPKATQHQFDALVSLAYNAGIGAVSGNLLTLIKRGASREAIQAWWKTHYITCKGKKLNGLIKRRAWEAEWYYS